MPVDSKGHIAKEALKLARTGNAKRALSVLQPLGNTLWDNATAIAAKASALEALEHHEECRTFLSFDRWDNLSDAAADTLFRQRMLRGIPGNAREHTRIWGSVPGNFSDALHALQPRDSGRLSSAKLAQQLRSFGHSLPADTLAKGIAWGRAARDYTTYLSRVLHSGDTSNDLWHLANDLQSKIHGPSIDVSPKRGLLAVQAHAGVMAAGDVIYDHAPLPVVRLSAALTTRSENSVLSLGVDGQAGTREFAKALKSVRKSPHLVHIFPDGRRGECVEIDVFGHKIPIGYGAMAFGWHGRMQTVFLHTEWKDGQLFVRATSGPDAQEFDDKDSYQQAFQLFYEKCLETVAMGAPRDMTGKGGFWTSLI